LWLLLVWVRLRAILKGRREGYPRGDVLCTRVARLDTRNTRRVVLGRDVLGRRKAGITSRGEAVVVLWLHLWRNIRRIRVCTGVVRMLLLLNRPIHRISSPVWCLLVLLLLLTLWLP
jgi:hypothetical protein